MILQAHMDRVVRRSRRFFEAATPGHFLVHAYVPFDEPPVRALCDFDIEQQLTEWLDYQLDIATARWRAKEGLDDDHIPSLCPTFGMAEYSAWLGMEVQLQRDTCLPLPLVHRPADLDRLAFSTSARWFQYLQRGYQHLQARKAGRYVVSFGGMIGPMDMANAVRGDDFFLDVLLDPDFAHRLLRRMVEASRWFFDHLLGWCDPVADGYVYQFGGFWLPGARPGHLTNDPAMMCGSEVYEAFGFPYERELAATYTGSLYHVHNANLRMVPRVAALPELRVLQISNDPKTTPVPEDLPRLYALTPPSLPLMMHATSDQIRAHLPELKQRNICLRVPCRDRADADDIVALVRRESRGLD